MSLAKHRIKIKSNDQRLRADAPFPSQVEDAQDAIRQWRHESLRRRLDGATGGDLADYLDVDDFVEGVDRE